MNVGGMTMLYDLSENALGSGAVDWFGIVICVNIIVQHALEFSLIDKKWILLAFCLGTHCQA